MRADARRNRERIVGAALALFTERGPRVSMEEIACAAEVGVGTLYRHFPDRATLAEEIWADALGDLIAFTRERLAEEGPRWEALRRVVEHSMRQPCTLMHALTETARAGSPAMRPLEREADALLVQVIEAAQEEGTLRQDIKPREVVDLMTVVVCRPGARIDDPLTRVVMDGLRA